MPIPSRRPAWLIRQFLTCFLIVGLLPLIIRAGETSPSPLLPDVFGAALEGDWATIKQALEDGYQTDSKGPGNRTALMLAAYNGHTKVVAKLIEAGADPNARDEIGSTALMFAASGPFVETVNLLLDKGAEINAIDSNEHFSALMWAAAEGQLEVVKLLLKHGADTSLKDIDGDSAASFAAKAGHTEVAEAINAAAQAPSP